MSLSRTVAEALKYLATVRNYSPATIENYEASFAQFRHFLYSQGLPDDARQFAGDNVLRFAETLAARKMRASSVVIRLSALSTIAKTLMKLRDGQGRPYLAADPTRTFEWPTPDHAETKFLLPDELAAFLAVRRPQRESIVRDVFVDTGMRCSEACRVNVGDVISVQGRTVLAVTVKGRGTRLRKRHVPLSVSVADGVFEYLMSRGISNPQDPGHRDLPLFLTSDGRRWLRSGLSDLMARIGREAGITRLRVSAHKLRHTANVVARFGRYADGSSVDRWTRSRLLNHTSPASLDRYEHLLPEELFDAREAQRRGLARYLADSARTDPGA